MPNSSIKLLAPKDMHRFNSHSGLTVQQKTQLLLDKVKQRDPDQQEFLQCVSEIVDSLNPIFEESPNYLIVLESLLEPERTIIFRVPWVDDKGVQHVNRGYRVQFSSSLGPYKGGLRFHPTVNLSIVKFLGFEQIFKNALTGLPMGGAKGGSDFDPKNKSDKEIMSFCQSFMTELSRHIGPNVDVPAGDINVGAREIGYLFGHYKRINNRFEGTLTGKSLGWGGSILRPEATGYGAAYFANFWAADNNLSWKGSRCLISGSGNVAQYTVEKLLEFGAIPITMSDSSGFVLEPNGFTKEQLEKVKYIKNVKRGRISDYCQESCTAKYFNSQKPWGVENVTAAFPSATQNEITKEDALLLAKNGCRLVVEGANMPSTHEAILVFKENGIGYCPGKAANAGGVSVSGLEMSQNAMRLSWKASKVDTMLQDIMKSIYETSKAAAEKYGRAGDLQFGANIAGFLRVANAYIEHGCV